MRAPLLLLAGYALLLTAWVVGNPPFAAPDEANHYLRAIGISQGELIGDRSGYEDAGLNPKQSAFTRQTATEVTVPAGLAPDSYGCNADRPTESAACQLGVTAPQEEVVRSTAVGTYLPLPYLLPAAVMRAGDDPAAADRFGRAASALVFLAFLAAATFALWDPNRGAISLLGLAAAVTPMVIFCGAILNGSGLEIASAIAFTAALLRLSRDGPSPRGLWALLAVSGAALALSRPVGPQWIAIAVALGVALLGWEGTRRRFRESGRGGPVAVGAVLLATILNRIWEGAHGAGYHLGIKPLPDSLLAIPRGSKRIVPELIGNFGVLDTRLPTLAWLTGYVLIGVLFLLALRFGSTRERRVVAGATLVAVLLPGHRAMAPLPAHGLLDPGQVLPPDPAGGPAALRRDRAATRRGPRTGLETPAAAAVPGCGGGAAAGGVVGELAALRGGHRRPRVVLRTVPVEPARRLDPVGRGGGGRGGCARACGASPPRRHRSFSGRLSQAWRRRSEGNRRRPARTGRLGCSESKTRETKRAPGLIPTPGEGCEWR